MCAENDKQDKRHYVTLRKIKWATIILPILILVSLDWLRHNVLYVPLHLLPGFIGTYVALGIGIAIFSYSVFGLIDRLQRQSAERNRRLEALNDIIKTLAANSSLDEIMPTILDIIKQAMKVDAGLICLVNSEKEEHSVVCYSGFSPDLVKNIQRAKLGDDVIALEVVRTGRPVIMERVFEDARVAEVGRREGIRSAISAPLKSDGEVNGILAIATHTERHFSKLDQEFLDHIGSQLGLAIGKAMLYEQSRLRNRELSTLLLVGKVTTSSFDLDELIGQSLDAIIGATSADAAEIWLTEDNEEMVMRCHRGAHVEAFLEKTRFRVGEGILGTVAKSMEAILVHDLPSDKRFVRQKVTEAGFHTFCAMPLLFHDKVVGILVTAALPADAIAEQREMDLLEGIGEWVTLAIENARLVQQVQDMAIMQERARIAREMHDGMAQVLGYVNTQTIAVKKLLSDERLQEAREELGKMEEVARDLYTDVREAILGLRMGVGRPDGLLSALREYVGRYVEMSGIQVDIETPAEAFSIHLSQPVEIQLMRIIQEALTNVRKHSRATGVKLELKRNDNEIRITISDNGRGFEIARLPTAGRPRFGLYTMRERAEAVGGSLSINSAPEQGTTVEVRMPALHGTARNLPI